MNKERRKREQYRFVLPIQTRWADNDMYGHVNNVTYYSYFDTAANALLIQKAGFNTQLSSIIGLVVESQCKFHQELSYPEIIEVGVAIRKIGHSSITYDLAIFKQNEGFASADGYFVHVFVDRTDRKSTSIPIEMRDALTDYVMS